MQRLSTKYAPWKAPERWTLLKARGIVPADKYIGVNVADPNFQKVSWYPAFFGSTENTLYMGTAQAGMTLKATYTNADGIRAMKTFVYPTLSANTKCYWRVDHKYGAGPVVTGDVWTFGTGTCGVLPGDLSGDCKVTFVDFATLAGKWRVCNIVPAGDCNL